MTTRTIRKMVKAEVVEIGGQRYILDPRGRGEYVLPAETPEHLEAQKPTERDHLPGFVPEYSAEWRRKQSVAPASRSSRSCGNIPCPRPAKLGRKYCSDKCMNLWDNLRRNRRRRNKTHSDRWVTLVGGAPAHFERPFPGTMTQAKKLFVEHISEGVCQFRDDTDYCPSSRNPYGDPSFPRCLLYATYADDLMLWQARVSGHPAQRRYTTEDGRWKERPYIAEPVKPTTEVITPASASV